MDLVWRNDFVCRMVQAIGAVAQFLVGAVFDAKDMLGYQHSGFAMDAGVCIEAAHVCGAARH